MEVARPSLTEGDCAGRASCSGHAQGSGTPITANLCLGQEELRAILKSQRIDAEVHMQWYVPQYSKGSAVARSLTAKKNSSKCDAEPLK